MGYSIAWLPALRSLVKRLLVPSSTHADGNTGGCRVSRKKVHSMIKSDDSGPNTKFLQPPLSPGYLK